MSSSAFGLLIVGGLFGFGRKKEEAPAAPPAAPTRRVIVEGTAAPVLPTPTKGPDVDPLKQRLLFQGLHEDFNPNSNVRTANMTCPSCATNFRYFLNSDGKKTMVKCPGPGCGKVFRL